MPRQMEVSETSGYETVLRTVRQWPPTNRFALIRDVINTLSLEIVTPRPKRKTLEKARGLLSTDRPAPSDTDIQQWLGERRMEKYGQIAPT